MFVAVSEFLSQWLGHNRVADMAERVAGRSRLAVWQRVNQRLPALGPTEGRGYVRARAGAIVRDETFRLIEQEGASIAARRAEIEEAAMNLLVDMISDQVRQPRSQSAGRRAA
jgi:hypothetical protein